MQAGGSTGLLPQDANGRARDGPLDHLPLRGAVRMRAVFLNRYFHPDHSATSQMLSDLAFHLAGRGLSVQVITGCQLYDAPDAQLAATEEVRGVSVRRIGTTRFGRQNLVGRALDYLSFYRGAAKALDEIARPGDLVVAKTDPPMLGAFV